MASADAARSVSSMFGSWAGLAAKSIPIPTIAAVNSLPTGRSREVATRLYAMAKPHLEIRHDGAYMVWPVGMGVLAFHPRRDLGELIGGGCQGDAVLKVEAAIAQSEDLTHHLHTIDPVRRQNIRQRR